MVCTCHRYTRPEASAPVTTDAVAPNVTALLVADPAADQAPDVGSCDCQTNEPGRPPSASAADALVRAASVGVPVASTGRPDPVVQPWPCVFIWSGVPAVVLYVMASPAEAWSKRFHWPTVDSLPARRPTLAMVGVPEASDWFTMAVA